MSDAPLDAPRVAWPPRPRWILTEITDWLPLAFCFIAYDEINNLLGPILPPAHLDPQLACDRLLFGGQVLAVRLQQAFYTPGRPHVWDWLAMIVYSSHFFVPTAGAVLLRFRGRERFRPYIARFATLTTLGFLTYIAYPAIPPWLASLRGFAPPLHRIVRELWTAIGRPDVAVLFAGSNVYANDVAALPSLHAAYPLLLAIFFWRAANRVQRVLLAAYVPAMAIVLAYFGEHYAFDVMLGWVYVGVTLALVAFVKRLSARASRRAPRPRAA